jgi:flagellar hook protein FlgE
MSLFGALTTAISGLGSQSRSLGHISDNVANSQTVGFKRIDTNFVSYLTSSSASAHSPGTVVARPSYTNTVQGTIEQSDYPLALAIGGQGFFSVASSQGTVNGLPTFEDRQFYTRAGDFRMDRDGYIRNGSGYYLQGWPIDATTNEPDRTIINPIRIDQQVFNPVPTTEIDYSAFLPATAAVGNVYTSQANAYDALGIRQPVNLTFTKTATNTWDLTVGAPNSTPASFGPTTLTFGDGVTGNSGTIVAIGGVGVAGDPAIFSIGTNFGQGTQSIDINFGTFNEATGLTQFDADDFSVRNQSQNGVPLGAYAGVTLAENGDVFVNYDNGQSRIAGRIPLVAFNDPDKLQRLDGQAFQRTLESGEARVTDASSNGVGKLVTGSIERANVDIANEFTKLIVAQRAYTANTRIVTTADELLQETINMKR